MKLLRLISILLLVTLMVGCNVQGEQNEGTQAPSETVASTEKRTDSPTEKPTQKPTDTAKPNEGEPVAWDKDGALKILSIGNSFSDDTMQYVYSIASDLGIENIKLGNLYIGGCTLSKHATNARGDKAAYDYRTNSDGSWKTTGSYKMSDAIRSESWDFITIQQASGSSGIDSTYGDLDYMISYVNELCPTAMIAWNMTWAYQQNSSHSEFSKYGNNQITMYNSIVDVVQNVIEKKDKIQLTVPNGTAIQNARTSYIGDTLTRDGYHLSYDLGRYIAGLTLVYKLTGMDISNIIFAPGGVDSNTRNVAVESAMNAVKSPFSVTESQYDEAVTIDLSNYEEIDMGWTPLGYWNSKGAGNTQVIISNGTDLSKKYYASRMFTRETLPVGSIIVLSEGWKYRPDAWDGDGALSTARPGVTSQSVVTVTNEWWGAYTARGFNLSRSDDSSLESIPASEVTVALRIYVPKNN